MSNFNNFGSALDVSAGEIWLEIIGLVPKILVAVIIFIAGLFIAEFLGRVTAKILKRLYVDRVTETTGLKKILERIGFKIEISKALSLLVTWFLYAIVLVVAADILGLSQISGFLQAVVLYIPNVIIAIVILIVGIVVSNFIYTLVKETSLAAKLKASDFLASVARWAILVFTLMAALLQLKVATELIQILFTGLILMLSLAGGIAFGLAGKDKAKEILDQLSKK